MPSWYELGMEKIPISAVGNFDNLRRKRAARVVKMDWWLDPVLFARRAGFQPDERQLAVLRSTAPRGILNCCRQWGKSTVTAAKALHHAYGAPKRLVVVGSATERQSGEFLLKARTMARELGITPVGDGIHSCSLQLPNGSRLVGLPQNEEGVRGLTATLLVVDEAARVADSFYKALRPMVATTAGAIWLMSTPLEKRGFFYDAWQTGDLWERFQVKATECERIPAAFLEEERSAMGDAWFRQEYLAEFMDIGGGFFAREMVEAALVDELEPFDLRMRS